MHNELNNRIEALERDNAALRDNDAKMQLLHQQEDQLIAAERKVAELEARDARLSEALREALAANERDRTEVIIAVNALTDAFARRDWLIRGGRGSYEWDDDRFRDEFRDAMEEFEPHVDQLRKIGADRTNCPATQAEVVAARSALSGSGSGWREITEEDRPPNDVEVLMGCWESWPRNQWVVEYGLYGSTKGGWIHGRMTHWLPSSYLPAAPQQGGE